MKKEVLEVTGSFKIEIPLTPNFLRVAGQMNPWPIESFDDAELNRVGKAWTDALIKRARLKRDFRKTEQK